MAEGAQDSINQEEPMEKKGLDIESQIQTTMRSRVRHFQDQADSLTFEGVRRLLEKDLELETYALDKHKKFIKQCLSECLEGANDDNVSKNSGDTVEKNDPSTKEEAAESPEKHQTEKNGKEPSSEVEEKMEDSPVMGLLTGHKTATSDETKGNGKKEVPSESTIRKAIWKRATYLKANSHDISMAGVRRLLEEDLKLDKNTLDPFKKFISGLLDKVLTSSRAPASEVTKKQATQKKGLKKISTNETSDSSDSDSEEVEDKVMPKKKVAPKGKVQKSEDSDSEEVEDKVKPKKKVAPKGKVQKSEDSDSEEVEDKVMSKKKVAPKGKVQKSEELKRKRPAMETKMSNKKQKKLEETISKENSDAEDGDDSEDEKSHSSAERPVKKKEVAAPPAYGKKMEHLKSIIKACAMGVPPVIYKRAKQVPENEREAFLIKELEDILSKEGLSKNPTEKEIKDVKKRKERAKELEGIDMSNIVLSSRRRSTSSFIPPPPPPKPKKPVESEGGDDDDDAEKDATDDNNGSDNENDESDNENDEDDNDSDDDGDESQSEEEDFNEEGADDDESD